MNSASKTVLPDLRDYQRQGIDWIKAGFAKPHNGVRPALLLADDPGLGKSLQTLVLADEVGLSRLLILAPAIARLNWETEILKWFPTWASRIAVILPGDHPKIMRTMVDHPKAITIVGYDTLSQNSGWTIALANAPRWDLLVLDEAHYLKTPGAVRTLHTYGGGRDHRHPLVENCDRVLLLTGTPTPNHAGELYTHCAALWPWSLSVPSRTGDGTLHTETKAEFEERYTVFRDTSSYGRQIIGSQNQDRLRELLGPVVLRRRKRDVLTELPPVTYRDVPLALTQMQRTLLAEAERPFKPIFDRALDQTLITTLASRHEEAGTSLSTMRRVLGEAKLDATVDYVCERLECGINKIILFGWHTQVLVNLYRRLAEFSPVLVHGASSPKQRATSIERFQKDPICRVYVGQIIASGTAITLTLADEVAIVEPSWVPGENEQCIARADRLGRRTNVLASFLYVPNSLDQKIMRVFRRKAEEIAHLHDHNHKGTHHHASHSRDQHPHGSLQQSGGGSVPVHS